MLHGCAALAGAPKVEITLHESAAQLEGAVWVAGLFSWPTAERDPGYSGLPKMLESAGLSSSPRGLGDSIFGNLQSLPANIA
jgi:hypothetical protein